MKNHHFPLPGRKYQSQITHCGLIIYIYVHKQSSCTFLTKLKQIHMVENGCVYNCQRKTNST